MLIYVGSTIHFVVQEFFIILAASEELSAFSPYWHLGASLRVVIVSGRRSALAVRDDSEALPHHVVFYKVSDRRNIGVWCMCTSALGKSGD